MVGYFATNTGDIISMKRNRTTIVKQSLNTSGYPKVCLMHNGKQKVYEVHRLIAITFIKNLFNKPTVNHKDGIKTNNNVDNLEWATQREQNLHAFRLGLQQKPVGVTTKGLANPSSIKVICTVTNKQYNTREAAEIYGCCPQHMGNMLKGKKRNTSTFIYANTSI